MRYAGDHISILGPPVAPFCPFLAEGSPTKIDYRKKLVPLFYPLHSPLTVGPRILYLYTFFFKQSYIYICAPPSPAICPRPHGRAPGGPGDQAGPRGQAQARTERLSGEAPRILVSRAYKTRSNKNCGAFCWDVRTLNFLPTNGFSIEPLKVKLLAGEQKATEKTRVLLVG